MSNPLGPDCFTMIKLPYPVMGHGHYVFHGIGAVLTGSRYIRSEPFYDLGLWHVDWENMGYTWSPVVEQSDSVPVIRMCRDTTIMPDNSPILADSFAKAEIEDVAFDNGKLRWVKIFQHLHGETTTKVGIFQENTTSRACNHRSTDRCSSKEIIKLILRGDLAVVDKYKCAFESKMPQYPNRPAYKFNKKLPMVDLVDSKIRTTLAWNEIGGEIAIVSILGRIHLIKRESYEHEWNLINIVEVATTYVYDLSYAIGDILWFNSLEYELRVMHGRNVTVPTFSTRNTGTVELSGSLGCKGDLIHVV